LKIKHDDLSKAFERSIVQRLAVLPPRYNYLRYFEQNE